MTESRNALQADVPADFVPGNHFDKYRSRNFVHRILMDGFLSSARSLLLRARPRRILEVGCGPGDLAARLLDTGPANPSHPIDYTGIDVSEGAIAAAREASPHRDFRVASAYALPFDDASFDMVIACEVLEHLERPADAIREIARVSNKHLLLSVPWEPAWRLLNLARGKYVARLGNTPGHVQHFSRAMIRGLVGPSFAILAEERPLPWTMLLAARRSP
jgi:ubiquinone/menaquinone biosynthesis C-methylase UbiE